MARIAVCGGPKTGKTTLAKRMPGKVYATDDLIEQGWSKASDTASRWFDGTGALLVEGVAVPRALRKWLDKNPKGKPVDRVIYLTKPHRTLTKGQLTMSKGVRTVFDEIRPELEKRGVEVEVR